MLDGLTCVLQALRKKLIMEDQESIFLNNSSSYTSHTINIHLFYMYTSMILVTELYNYHYSPALFSISLSVML